MVARIADNLEDDTGLIEPDADVWICKTDIGSCPLLDAHRNEVFS